MLIRGATENRCGLGVSVTAIPIPQWDRIVTLVERTPGTKGCATM